MTPEEIKRQLNEKVTEYQELDNMLRDLRGKIADYDQENYNFVMMYSGNHGDPDADQEEDRPKPVAVNKQKKDILKKYGQSLHDQIEAFFEGPKGYDDASVAEWVLENYVAVRLFTSSDFIVNSPLKSLGNAEGRIHEAAKMAKLFLLKYLPEDSTLFWGSDKHVPETEENYNKFMPDNFEKLPGKREGYINIFGPLSGVKKDIRSAVKGVKANKKKPAKTEPEVKPEPAKVEPEKESEVKPEPAKVEPEKEPEVKPEPAKVEPEKKPEVKQPDPAVEVQMAVKAGEDALAEYKVEPEFKERIKELFDGYELSPSEESLFKFFEKYASKGDQAAAQTRKWLADACELKKEGKDYSAQQKEIADGISFIKVKAREFLEQRAAECDEYIQKECSSDQAAFLKHWSDAQSMANIYSTVFAGANSADVEPENAEHIRSILKNVSVLNKKMAAITASAAEIKSASSAKELKKDNPIGSIPQDVAAEQGKAPESVKEKSLYEQDKDPLNSILQKLRNARTTTNSDEYKTIISTLKDLNSKEDIPAENGQKLDPAQTHAVKLLRLKVAVNNYLKHKSRDGVKKNTYHKLAAVEELNQFVTQRMNGLDFEPFNYLNIEIKPQADQNYVIAHGYTADEISKGVAAANRAGIKTDAAEATRVQDCMQKIIGMASGEKNKSTLSSMKKDFLKYPAPVSAPKLSSADIQDAVKKAKQMISPRSASDYDAISSAYTRGAYDDEFDEERKFLFSYAERNGLIGKGTQHYKMEGKSLTSVILDEAERVNNYYKKQLKKGYSNGSHRADEVQMTDSFYAFNEIKEVVKEELKSSIDANVQLSKLKLSDDKLASNWPEITEKLAGYELVLGKGSNEKCDEIIDNYNKMKARMNRIAERSAGQAAKSQKQQVL